MCVCGGEVPPPDSTSQIQGLLRIHEFTQQAFFRVIVCVLCYIYLELQTGGKQDSRALDVHGFEILAWVTDIRQVNDYKCQIMEGA